MNRRIPGVLLAAAVAAAGTGHAQERKIGPDGWPEPWPFSARAPGQWPSSSAAPRFPAAEPSFPVTNPNIVPENVEVHPSVTDGAKLPQLPHSPPPVADTGSVSPAAAGATEFEPASPLGPPQLPVAAPAAPVERKLEKESAAVPATPEPAPGSSPGQAPDRGPGTAPASDPPRFDPPLRKPMRAAPAGKKPERSAPRSWPRSKSSQDVAGTRDLLAPPVGSAPPGKSKPPPRVASAGAAATVEAPRDPRYPPDAMVPGAATMLDLTKAGYEVKAFDGRNRVVLQKGAAVAVCLIEIGPGGDHALARQCFVTQAIGR